MASQSHHGQYDRPFAGPPSRQSTPISPLLPSQRLPLLQTTDIGQDAHDLNFQLVSPMMSRSASIASDSRFSALSGGTAAFPSYPTDVQPQAAYVAPFSAAQVIREHQTTQEDEDHHKPSKDDATFSPSALALINAFLDQLLFSFLSTAKSSTLSALRPAVTDVLRHKLARDAIASANEELADLLAGGEDEEKELRNGDASHWDPELVWRRTRLRVMVYMRLGDMEDDDAERHVKQQELLSNGARPRFSSTAGLVSWSAAIFLTSILEHVAEETLRVAGTAAFSRLHQHDGTSEETSKAVVVEDQDAERIALNPALGRLWRSWRKTMRANVRPTTPRSPHGEVPIVSSAKSVSTFRDSFSTAPESAHEDEEQDVEAEFFEYQYPEHILASNIPLPMGDPLRDVDEIEVPGLARDPSVQDATPSISVRPDRRRSFSSYLSRQAEVRALSGAIGLLGEEDDALRPGLQRKRSSSVPKPFRNVAEAFSSPTTDDTAMETNTKTIDDKIANEKVLASEEISHGPVYGPVEQKDFDFTIDEVDKRKSLIDIKTLLAAINGGQAAFVATREGPEQNRPNSADSDQSFSLRDKANDNLPQHPVAERQHMTNASEELALIGVATTSDQAVEPARTPSATGARGASPSPMLVNNVSRASSVARSKYSPQLSEDARQAQHSTDEAPARDRPIAPNEQTLAALRESVQRASSPQAAQQEVTDQTSQPNRKSMALQYPISAFNSKSQANETIEHPLLQQKKASDPNRLTSASIRAPEDFDQFIQSDEVVRYTLTPEPIRNAPASDAQALAMLTGQVPPVVQPTSSNDPVDRRSRRSQLGKDASPLTAEELDVAEKKRRRWSITRPPTRNSSVHRRSGLMAREARVMTESTRDFADFIRSTKPDKEPQIQPIASVQSLRNSTNYSLPRSQSFTGDRTRSLTRSDIAAGHAPPVPIIPSKGDSSMQSKLAGNGEVIAFIRDDQHRVSRSGAPSRSTIQSDQFDAQRGGTGAKEENRSLARASMVAKTVPVNGSISNAGNIAHPAYSGQRQPFNPAATHPAYSGQRQFFSPAAAHPDAIGPERKRYRNKDPYAIDLSDEEDISALPKSRQGADTLAGFPRSDEEEGDGDLRPIASASSLAQARDLRERARAKESRNNSINGTIDEVTAMPQQIAGTTMEARPPTSGRAGSGTTGRSDTNDLAVFLRNSGPPAAAPAPGIGRGVQAQKSSQAKGSTEVKEKKFRGLFSFFRRSPPKATPTRHSDMP